MKIINTQVYTEEGKFKNQEIRIRNGLFEAEALDQDDKLEDEVIDASGLLAIPGLIDIHLHGCVGVDLCDGTMKAIRKMAKYQLINGITSMCPATMTIPETSLLAICKTAALYEKLQREGNVGEENAQMCAARLVGIRLEGPFLSVEKKGAQKAEDIRTPDICYYRKLQEASNGLIRLVDLAPEELGAMEFIQAVKQETVVSLAHTNADYDTAVHAFACGASHVTHLYNAMPAYHHRAPGVVGAAADCDDCQVELICDGIHIHPSVVRNTFRMFGKDRIILISDSMMATGMEDGQYWLGGQKVYVRGKKAELADGTVAGSVTNLMECVRVCVKEMGIPIEAAIQAASINPARSIGIDGKFGSIAPGKVADFVFLTPDLEVRQVYKNGIAML